MEVVVEGNDVVESCEVDGGWVELQEEMNKLIQVLASQQFTITPVIATFSHTWGF